MAFSGSLADVNVALGEMVYQGHLNFNGADTGSDESSTSIRGRNFVKVADCSASLGAAQVWHRS
jgi:hypothetical protein